MTYSSDGFGRPRSAVRWLLTPASDGSTAVRVGPEGSDADLQIKQGAKAAEVRDLSPAITGIYPQVVDAWRDNGGPTPVITSGTDGDHKRGSLHYSGEAIDIRCNNIPDAHCQRITDALQKSLGPDFDVIFERFPKAPSKDHIHIEHDPRPRQETVKPRSMLGPGDGLPMGEWMRRRNRQAEQL